MPSETNEPQPVLRQTHNNHVTAKEKMEHLKNPVSSTFKTQDITDLAERLENLAQNTPLRFSDEAMRPPTKSNSRFGNLSNHPFFYRHNPHPHRVTHIQGLNGIPICIVNDEWNVTSPLYPHPMIKSKLPTNLLGVPSLPIGDPHGNMVPFLGAAGPMSEGWREELRELASKVCTTNKEPEKQVEEPRRSTQYSSETGRIIPASARALTRQASRKASRTSNTKGKNASTNFQDKELIILELLCQILQTDSLSAIQQWLLSAGQREKDLVMNMIQTATANIQHESMGERLFSQHSTGLLSKEEYLQRKNPNSRSNQKPKAEPIPEEDKPERIGTAEVLQIHAADNENQDKPSSAK
ncbi:protein TBATA-like isoform X1 [Bufo gargarizans]|uniref:protein TBATA-like isoform X1 n=1 Tax=Bufo gargarizans TaxID=30331 RepID=UPI001CF580D6|nr:protein TBATA-like isoform X1 [Bufo gargarizans]XP_044160781.1 protein TBATA-like isoform X1 [Bufo gargarizans]